MGCLRLGACLGFFGGCWVEAWPFPLFLVFGMVRVREVVGERLGVRVDFWVERMSLGGLMMVRTV